MNVLGTITISSVHISNVYYTLLSLSVIVFIEIMINLIKITEVVHK